MKKIMFVMPLMAISLLASCGGSKEPAKVSYTLTYTYDNGSTDKYVETYAKDKKTIEPTWEPTYPGNTFKGWFTKSGEDGTQFTFGNVLTTNTVIYAHWSKTPEPKTTYHLTFNGTNCKMDGTDKYEEDIPIGATTQRKIYPNEGYALPVLGEGGLVIEGDGASSVSYEDGNIKITKFSGNVVITAESKVKDCVVTFNAKDGVIIGDVDHLDIQYGTEYGSIQNLPTAKPNDEINYRFDGWALTPTSSSKVPSDYTITDAITLYAIYAPNATATVTLDGTSTNCKLCYGDVECYLGDTITIPAGKDITLTIEPNEGYLPIFEDNLTVTTATSSSFIPSKQEITINVAKDANCSIKATTTEAKNELKDYSWPEINEISENGVAPLVFKVGDEKLVNVNSKLHRVRIIGFNHDELSSSSVDNPEFAGITFEFANLISDSDGFSLATLWNWESGEKSTNGDYLNSNLRKAIDGGGSQSTRLNWYQINGTKTSEEYKTSVLDMITSNPDNAELKDALKEVRKPIAIKSGTDYIVDGTSYTTKLFPLSCREITEESYDVAEEGKTYAFYKGEGDTNDNRIKWQVNHHAGAIDYSTKIDEADKTWGPSSYAGFNVSGVDVDDEGGYSWLRSPNTANSIFACRVHYRGTLGTNVIVSEYALAVAPAFCI